MWVHGTCVARCGWWCGGGGGGGAAQGGQVGETTDKEVRTGCRDDVSQAAGGQRPGVYHLDRQHAQEAPPADRGDERANHEADQGDVLQTFVLALRLMGDQKCHVTARGRHQADCHERGRLLGRLRKVAR